MRDLSKLTESTSPSVNPKVDNEPLVIMMCQCRFILSEKMYHSGE